VSIPAPEERLEYYYIYRNRTGERFEPTKCLNCINFGI